MNTLTTFARFEVWLFLLALTLIVSYQLLIGRINMTDLLYEKINHLNYSPVRVQLLVFTMASAFYLLMQVLANPHTFPQPLAALFVVLGGKPPALSRE